MARTPEQIATLLDDAQESMILLAQSAVQDESLKAQARSEFYSKANGEAFTLGDLAADVRALQS